MKHIADLKSFLEEQIAEIKEEIATLEEELQTYEKALEGVDAILTKEGFVSAAEMIKAPEKSIYESEESEYEPEESGYEPEEPESKIAEPIFKPVSGAIPEKEEKVEKKEFPVKDKMGKLLGKVSVSGNTMSIVPEQDLKFSTQAPPFKSFFKGKIINRMETEDDQAIKEGTLSKAEKISVDIINDDNDNIQNIIIQNFRKYDRMMDLINTITWTFRKIAGE